MVLTYALYIDNPVTRYCHFKAAVQKPRISKFRAQKILSRELNIKFHVNRAFHLGRQLYRARLAVWFVRNFRRFFSVFRVKTVPPVTKVSLLCLLLAWKIWIMLSAQTDHRFPISSAENVLVCKGSTQPIDFCILVFPHKKKNLDPQKKRRFEEHSQI